MRPPTILTRHILSNLLSNSPCEPWLFPPSRYSWFTRLLKVREAGCCTPTAIDYHLMELMFSHRRLQICIGRFDESHHGLSKMGSNNQQLNLSRNMMRRARLNRRGKRVCNCSRMMTWIQERKVYIDTFLSWRNPKKQNKLRATWLTPQLALHQFARPIVTFRLSAFLRFLGVHLTHHRLSPNTSIELSASCNRTFPGGKAKTISIPSAIFSTSPIEMRERAIEWDL